MLRRPAGERLVDTQNRYSCTNKKFFVFWMEGGNAARTEQVTARSLNLLHNKIAFSLQISLTTGRV